MFATYRPILSLLRGTAFLLAASGTARPAVAAARPARRVLDRIARPDGHGLGRRLRHRLLLCAAHRAPRRPCQGLRRLCRVGSHRRAAHRPDHRRICLDPAARLHRLHHGRRLHGHRKLAEREGHQREPRHRLRPLHDGHLCLDHGRPDDRCRRRREIGVAVHDHRHIVLPVADPDRRLVGFVSQAAAGRQARRQGPLCQLAGVGDRLPFDRHRQRRLGHAGRRLWRPHRHFHAPRSR